MIHTGMYYEQALTQLTQFFNTFFHFLVKLALAARLSKWKHFFSFFMCVRQKGA